MFEMSFPFLCRVYSSRFDNQVSNGKFIKTYFLVVKLKSSLFYRKRDFIANSNANFIANSRTIFVKTVESLLHTTSKKFEF